MTDEEIDEMLRAADSEILSHDAIASLCRQARAANRLRVALALSSDNEFGHVRDATRYHNENVQLRAALAETLDRLERPCACDRSYVCERHREKPVENEMSIAKLRKLVEKP